MLFYNFNILDNFIKNNFITNLKQEKENIEKQIKIYENKKINLLAITDNMVNITHSIKENKLNDFRNVISLLKNDFENINDIQTLASKLSENLSEMISLYDKGLEYNIDEIKANLVEYNKQRDNLENQILNFENINIQTINSAIEISLKLTHKNLDKKLRILNNCPKNNKRKIDIELEPYDNNTLIISEKDQKAYLPFFYSDVKKIFENSNQQYKTMQDVVNDIYIIPLKHFKNSSLSRFRESFHLVRDKEKDSILKALDLGLELMFKYELNPIIIAACRNLDELDIYLDCLEENNLSDFSCFKINFEVSLAT